MILTKKKFYNMLWSFFNNIYINKTKTICKGYCSPRKDWYPNKKMLPFFQLWDSSNSFSKTKSNDNCGNLSKERFPNTNFLSSNLAERRTVSFPLLLVSPKEAYIRNKQKEIIVNHFKTYPNQLMHLVTEWKSQINGDNTWERWIIIPASGSTLRGSPALTSTPEYNNKVVDYL